MRFQDVRMLSAYEGMAAKRRVLKRCVKKVFAPRLQGESPEPRMYEDGPSPRWARTIEVRSIIEQDKYILRCELRHLHLARMFLKGKPYQLVEPKVRQHNKPRARRIQKILHSYNNPPVPFDVIKEWLGQEEKPATVSAPHEADTEPKLDRTKWPRDPSTTGLAVTR